MIVSWGFVSVTNMFRQNALAGKRKKMMQTIQASTHRVIG
jgi:hypothetical protein